MKLYTLLFTLAFAVPVLSQEYISVSGIFYPNAGENYSGGVLLSGGKYVSGATLGIGTGVILFNEDDPFIPVYADFGYIGKRKLAPYFNVKMGWSFYEGSAKMVGEIGTAKGGLFTNVSAGGNYRFAKNFRVALHGGVTALMLRKKLINKTETFPGSFFNAGLSLIYAK
jgi:hypothetical protein